MSAIDYFPTTKNLTIAICNHVCTCAAVVRLSRRSKQPHLPHGISSNLFLSNPTVYTPPKVIEASRFRRLYILFLKVRYYVTI